MVTVYLKTQPPVVVKDGDHTKRADFNFQVFAEGNVTPLAEFNLADMVGYMRETGKREDQ